MLVVLTTGNRSGVLQPRHSQPATAQTNKSQTTGRSVTVPTTPPGGGRCGEQMQLSSVRWCARTLRHWRATVVTRRAVDLAIAIGLFIVVATSVGPDAAYAHDVVVSSMPAAGSVVQQAPRAITLKFQGSVTRAAVEVTNGCGTTVSTAVTTSGAQVTAALGGQDAADDNPRTEDTERSSQWNVTWRAVGGDGHLTQGEVPFVVRGKPRCEGSDDNATGTAPGTPGSSPVGTAPDTAAGTPADPVGAVTPEQPAQDTASETQSGGFPMLPVVAAILALLGALAAALVTGRSPRSQS